jgi:hypothetical protein
VVTPKRRPWLVQRYLITGVSGVVARQRPIALAFLTTVTSALTAWWVQKPDVNLILVAVLVSLAATLWAGLVGPRYERALLVELMLPAIHHVLGLHPEDRITVHVLRSGPKKTFEQLTDYYPRLKPDRGRIFPLNWGIVGYCFHSHRPDNWAVGDGETFEDAYRRARWQFTDEDLTRISKEPRSYFAYPIGRDGPYAKAVLYADSKNRETFADGSQAERCRLIEEVFLSSLTEALRGT